MNLLRPLPLFLALGLGTAMPLYAWDGSSGPYLAGRLASLESDYVAAAEYYSRALVADPDNPALIENLVVAEIGQGDIEKALEPALKLGDMGLESQVADLVVLADLAKKNDFEAAIAALEKGRTAGGLVDGLFRAWSLVGLGRMSEATAAFDAVSEQSGGKAFGLYHKALALASVGDFEGADRIFSGEEGGPLRATKRGVLAHAQVLSQLERNPDAVQLIDATIGAMGPLFADLRAELAAGKPVPFTVVNNATDGLAEVFYTVATALNSDAPDVNTLAYARMAEYLAPKLSDATLLSASILEAQGQYELATETYNRIGRDDPAYVSAELGRSEALIASGKVEAAIEVLQQLAKAEPDHAGVWGTLGDTFRREERYGEAAKAYDKAIATFGPEEPGQWFLYYTRGICNEREKNWTKAEADFRRALELQPGQPAVLNYLGYSYLEKNENLEEALAMIEQAAEAQPDNGAIIDSLGWGLFLAGRYDDAVAKMEVAIQLMPVDPVVNDHLGDVYWAVGRKREAEFQWRRALSFDTEADTEADAERIRRKLEVGLDVVLHEEGAEPLAVSKNGN